jgi:DNA-binding transcriptional LysR family regulator
MLQLLQSSDAVAVLPESVVRDSLDTGLLRRLPIAVGGKALRLRRADAQVGAARPGRVRAGRPDAHLRGAHDESETRRA